MKKNYALLLLLSLFFTAETFAQSPSSFTYTGKPRYQLSVRRNNVQFGIIKVELFPNIAPHHTRNFDSLVSVGFFDTTAFHRVIPNFMIQGGDPNSRHLPKPTWGQGELGQPTVNAEFSVANHKRGILSAARDNNINSATSQFFICHAASLFLDGQYSIYGRVTQGINYVDTIALAPRDVNDCPNTKIEMFVTYIGSNDTIPNPPAKIKPKNDSMGVDTMLSLHFAWAAQSDGIIYTYQLSSDSTFATITNSVNTPDLFFNRPAGLPGSTKFFWRVRNNNGGHFSAWSPVWHFYTQGEYVGIKKNSIDKESVIVYPNPSTGKFNFKAIEKGSKIEIFDMSGKMVLQTTAKETEITIDLETKDKGVYTYRLSSLNGSTKQGKLLLK
jgi:peptidyl-prolyl cis-trans isomerase B (cyclophilin B)